MKIFLDDLRNPPNRTWTVVRSYDGFVDLVKSTPHIITDISFDHDLGLESDNKTVAKTGMDAAKFLIDYIMDVKPQMGQLLERVSVHSANPQGRENILSYFKSARKAGIISPDLEIIE